MMNQTGAVIGGPRVLLRLEGFTVLLLGVALYARSDNSWWLFAILFLAPDLALLGYLADAKIGAIAYNALHTYVGPALLAVISQGTGAGMAVAIIWATHIGMDRSIALGLKYATAFRETHLGTVGAGASSRGG
jgi:hypothetical protein